MQPLNVMLDGSVFAWQKRGGISRIYAEMIPRVAELADDIALTLAIQGKPKSRMLEQVKIPRSSIPDVAATRRPWRFWSRAAPLMNVVLARRYWSRCRMDVFHPTYYTAPPIDAPSFCFVYDMLFELFPECFEHGLVRMMRQRKRRAIDRAKVVLCISESTRNDVIRLLGTPAEKCRVVHLAGSTSTAAGCGAQPGELQASDGLRSRPFLLYVGDWETPYKNFDFVLQALGSNDFAEFSDLDLVVVAPDKPEPAKIHSCHERMGAERLHFLHSCDDEELGGLYADCAAFVMPSFYEGFGLPVLEAMKQGAPVVCSDTSSLPEVGGEAAFYFDPRSPAQFADSLRRALAQGRDGPAVAGRQAQAAKFSWDRTAAEFCRAARETGGRV